MSLKKNRSLTVILWLAATFMLTAGLTLLSLTFVKPDEIVSGVNTTAIETTSKPAETESPSTVPDGTMEGTLPLPSEPEDFDTVKADEQEEDTEKSEPKPYFVLRSVSIFLLIFGAAAAVVYIFVLTARRPLFGADLSLLLLTGAAALMAGAHKAVHPYSAAMLLCGAALSLALLREVWAWIVRGMPLEWSAAHRLGRAVSAGHYSRYMVFQLVWTLILAEAAAVAAVGAVYRPILAVLSVICAVMASISFLLLWRLCSDTDHLAEQIRRLHRGDEAEARTGVFEDTEKQLIDMRRQMDDAIRSAVADERFKVELISNVSHDLRTPLTAILGYGELLSEEPLSQKGKMQLDRLNKKAAYMRDLVEELFELTKVSSGTVKAKREQIDLIRLLEQTLGLFDDRLTEAKLSIRRHYVSDRVPVISDGARLHQVFANLIGNAVKYTMSGTRIHIEVRENDEFYTVRMTNIASYEMSFTPEEAVQRFYRADKARSTEGSGLGLAIAKTYSESIGGKFNVEVDGEQFSAIVYVPKKTNNTNNN